MDIADMARRTMNFLDGKRLVKEEHICSAEAVELIKSLQVQNFWLPDELIWFKLTGRGHESSKAVDIPQQLAEKLMEMTFKNIGFADIRKQVYADVNMNRFSYLDMPVPGHEGYGFVISFAHGPERIKFDFLNCVKSLASMNGSDLIEGIDMRIINRRSEEFEYTKQTPTQAFERLNSDSVAPFISFEERLEGAKLFLEDFIGKRHEVLISLSGEPTYPVRVEMKYVHRMNGFH